MPEELRLGASGIWSDSSEIQAPPGAMRDAVNIRIRRPNVIEPRPGLPATAISGPTAPPRHLLQWAGGMLMIADGECWHVIQGGATTEVTDPASASLAITYADSCLVKVSDGVMVPTDNGVYYVDSDLDAYTAGVLAPAPPYTANGTGGSSVANGSSVAFRALVYRELASGRSYYSAPSERSVYTNSSGGALDVIVRVALPSDALAGDVVQVYASEIVAGTPSDEMTLLHGAVLTSSHISAGYAEFELDVTEADGASLYTNETQEGILQANTRPQPCKRVAWFNQMAFYGDVRGERRYTLEGKATNTAEELDNDSVGSATFTSGSAVVSVTTAEAQWAGLPVAETLGEPQTDGTYIPAGTYVVSVDTGANTFTMSNNALASGSAGTRFFAFVRLAGFDYIYYGGAGTPDVTIGQWQTGPQLIEAINLQGDVLAAEEGVGTIYQLATGAEDLGYIRISGTTAFTLEVFNGFAGTGWIWRLFSSAAGTYTATLKTTEDRPARLMWSKVLQPESVPSVNYIDLGSHVEPILALEATRDALFVFKRDGVWRVSGSSPETLRVDEFDRTIELISPLATTTHRGDVWAWTTQGILRINDGGAQNMSDNTIRDQVADMQQETYEQGLAGTVYGGLWLGSSETEGIVVAGLPEGGAEDRSFTWYVYESRTGAWVRWSGISEDYGAATSCSEDKGQLVFGTGDPASNGCYLCWADYDNRHDATVSTTITSFTADVEASDGVTYPGSIAGASFDTKGRRILDDSSGSAWILFSSGLTEPIVSATLAATATNGATIRLGFTCTISWVAMVAGNPGQMAHWRNIQMMFADASRLPGVTLGFTSERVPTEGVIEVRSYLDPLRPEPIQLRGSVTRSHARAKRLRIRAAIGWADQDWRLEGIALTFQPMRGGERTP